MALAARLPKLCTAASSPNADPRSSTGAKTATAACSAVSTPDRHPGGHEPRRQGQDAAGAGGEAGIGQPKQPHAEDQDQDGAPAIPEPTGGDAGHRRGGQVVGHVQAEGELSGPVLTPAGGEQLGGAQDEQGGGHIPELEGRHPDHQAAEASGQHRPDAQPQRLVLALLGSGGVADGVDDGQGGEQTGDDGQGDGGADPDQADQGQGEQGPTMAPRLSMARSNP
jgi:hypothetical protein